MLARCDRGDLFLPMARNVRSLEMIRSIDQLREHWAGVLFGTDPHGYLVADAAARGYLPLEVLPPDARDAEVLISAFGGAYSRMASNNNSDIVSWSPAYRRRLTEVILAHLDHIEAMCDTPETRWVAVQLIGLQACRQLRQERRQRPGPEANTAQDGSASLQSLTHQPRSQRAPF